MLTTAELVNLIHMLNRKHMPLVTDVVPGQNTVEYTVGFVRYLATRDREVMEVTDGNVFTSPNSWHQQNILRSAKTDDAGNLIVNELFEEMAGVLRGDSGSTIVKDK